MNKNVYCVIFIDYESNDLLGVFDSEEKAKCFLKSEVDDYGWCDKFVYNDNSTRASFLDKLFYIDKWEVL